MPMTGKTDRVEVITSVQRRRRWPAEEKVRIVQGSYAPGMSVSLVARRHGVAPNQVFKWRQPYPEGALSAVGAGEEVAAASEYRALQHQVRELQRLSGRRARTLSSKRQRPRHGSAGGLYPQRLEDEARAWQWSFWGLTEVERPALTALLNRVGPEDRRDATAADEAERALAAPLRVLDAVVAATPYLLGEHFTVADLNVASILSWARQARCNLAAFPKAEAWLKTCHDRPAAQAARQLQRE